LSINFLYKAEEPKTSVEIEGSFNDWSELIELQQNFSSVIQNEWVVELETTKKEFEFRFIVDGARMLSKDYPTVEMNQRGPLNLYQV